MAFALFYADGKELHVEKYKVWFDNNTGYIYGLTLKIVK